MAASTDGTQTLVETVKGMQPSIQKFRFGERGQVSLGLDSVDDEFRNGSRGGADVWHCADQRRQRNPLHKHPNCEELLYVLSGSFENVMGGKTVVMHAGDIVRIPANVPHQGINNTKEPMRAVISYSSGTRQMVALEAQTE